MSKNSSLPLACPVNNETLVLDAREFTSSSGLQYPTVGGVPWLFPDPKFPLSDWRERAAMLLGQLKAEVDELKISHKAAASELTRTRLATARDLKITHLEMLRRTLEPLKLQSKLPLPKQHAFGYRLPLRQGLLGYFPNLIRDWSTTFEIENSKLFAEARSHLENSAANASSVSTTGTVLILGAGGSRFAYDWARAFPNSTVIAFDLNPILLLAASRLNAGETLTAVETPFAPKDPAKPGREVVLKAPHGALANLHFVFGDVYALPFLKASIDLCITPWLVDILPRSFSNLCASIAHAVKPGGIWLNTGSFNFDFRNESENLSVQEAQEVAALEGWDFSTVESNAVSQVEIPYLQSEFDAHRRFETVTQFAWLRSQESVSRKPMIDDRVDWLRNTDLKIPGLPAFGESATTFGVRANLLSLADGTRSVKEIASILSAEVGLTPEDANDAVATFFDRFVRDQRFR